MKSTEKLLGNISDIAPMKNQSLIIKHLCRLAGITDEHVNIEEINNRASLDEYNRFFKKTMEEIEESSDRQFANYRWIDTGVVTPEQQPIILCLTKINNLWNKGRVGIGEILIKEALANYQQQQEEDNMKQKNNDQVKETGQYKEVENTLEVHSVSNDESKTEDTVSIEVEVQEDALSIISSSAVNSVKEEENHEVEETHVPVDNTTIGGNTIMTINPSNNVLMQNSWGKNDAMDYYLENICMIAMQKEQAENRILTNSDSTVYLINSGLLNRLGQDLYITYEYENREVSNIRKVNNKSELIKQGFTRKDAAKNLEPILAWVNEEELEFDAETIDDFDLQNFDLLSEIVESMQVKYGSHIQAFYNLEKMCERFEISINLALKINRRDKRYITPIYEEKIEGIAFMIPLYIDSINDAPSFVMIVTDHDNEFFEIIDIVDIDTAYLKAKLINPYIKSIY